VHEVSLIAELVNILEQSAREHGIVQVKKVRLVVGESYQALPEALATAFEVLTTDTLAAGAELEIGQVKVLFRCQECEREYGGSEWPVPCPACGSFRRTLVSGNELYLDYYEGETEADLSCE